ncbi:helix-turn-helix domain-containing protein [Paenibacillus sp. FSL R7-269]|uniref:helix-turn-helix domain-containing protein n=1 Tax=unclassified Paenibacillus TaxID=185978 RepID=UPI003FA3D44B
MYFIPDFNHISICLFIPFLPTLLVKQSSERNEYIVDYSLTLVRIGQLVRQCRLSQNLTQEQLAELVGTSHTTIGAIERGERNVTVRSLHRIADACQTDLFSMLLVDQPNNEQLSSIIALLIDRSPSELRTALNVLQSIFQPPS